MPKKLLKQQKKMVAKTLEPTTVTSVADPGCLSRIPYTDFYPSRIPDPTTAPKEEGGKNFLSFHFL
jgi:hypothetical protein